ncbi:FMN-binding glutamate synthase family protein [Bacillus pseudomycoides]|uniref:FMN-binding glutamate synthase family protein n=1 Tax=Bacillus pseudomycoides TaxID=64104 RepID=UPI000BF2142A|nr:FMN-binding glutamate synthase family protein [Bacillus pseudomycoides]PEM39110.1 FMN-binding glutamate synthase family protein [Bacillus pseudomycoides]
MNETLLVIISILLLLILLFIIFFMATFFIKKRTHHSILKLHPYLGRMRFLLEKIGPEFRQYWFDNDTDGKPFSRYDFQSVMFLAKYRSEVLGFGSKRDFDASGYYIANTLFPVLTEELNVDLSEERAAKKYVIHKEGVFSRKEKLTADETNLWLYEEDDAIVVGENRKFPWEIYGMFGASATSYGAIGENYILSTGYGSKMAGGSWINTGEGGVIPEHIQTGANIIAQIGPGLFGYRDEEGNFSMDEFVVKAKEPNIKAFELKFGQGAKIRGGHLEGQKVNRKIAAVRKVKEGETINSPNRFAFLHYAKDALRFIHDLQEKGGKPVGMKIVIGQQKPLEELLQTMKELNIYPDFITIDGSEGGSGATYKSMADSMGIPLIPALITFVDTACRFNVRDKLKVFASGKLVTPDKVAIALAIGADAVNSARGFMMASGCIMALQCHSGQCPSGVATTNPHYQKALDHNEKKWRVMNYIVSMRYSLFALSAAAGVKSPRHLTRDHIVFKDETGRVIPLSKLFPVVGEK